MRFERTIGFVAAGIAMAAGVAGCSTAHETKAGGAWATLPVKCSAYQRGSADYAACLERDREVATPYVAAPSSSSAMAARAAPVGATPAAAAPTAAASAGPLLAQTAVRRQR
jgi:hypothetical protein